MRRGGGGKQNEPSCLTTKEAIWISGPHTDWQGPWKEPPLSTSEVSSPLLALAGKTVRSWLESLFRGLLLLHLHTLKWWLVYNLSVSSKVWSFISQTEFAKCACWTGVHDQWWCLWPSCVKCPSRLNKNSFCPNDCKNHLHSQFQSWVLCCIIFPQPSHDHKQQYHLQVFMLDNVNG